MKTAEPRILAFLADVVKDEGEETIVRQSAYRSLFMVANRAWEKPLLAHVDVATEIDWEWVNSFGCDRHSAPPES